MTEEIIKCVKGESCIHCGSTYCRFVDEVNELKQENEKLRYKIQEVVQANDRIVAECAEIMKPKCETSMISELMKENEKLKEKIESFKTMATVPTRMYNECERERCRYRRTLEEIRVIADDTFEVCDDDCENAIKIKLIMDKTNEILNEKEL